MIVSISGFDGSGKSTLAKAIVNELNKQGLKSQYIHGYEFSFIHRYLKNQKTPSMKKIRERHVSQAPKSLLMKLWPWVLLIDFSLKLSIYKIFFKKTIYVFDRYIYDYLISCKYQSYALPIKFMIWITPKPHIAFFLSPSLNFSITNRSSEHSNTYFKDMNHLYSTMIPKFAESYKSGLNKASQDAKSLIEKILHAKK